MKHKRQRFALVIHVWSKICEHLRNLRIENHAKNPLVPRQR